MSRTYVMLRLLVGVGMTLLLGPGLANAQSIGQPQATELVGALTEGQPAPALHVQKWLAGAPVESLTGGKVFVVEFWATWCPASRRAVPVLTRAQQQHGDRVTIIAVIGADGEEETAVSAERFVGAIGAGIGYTVGFDERQRTRRDWMDAADQKLIPTAFIVDRSGTVAWIGNPIWPPGEFEDALGQVVAGTFGPSERAATRARWLEHRERIGTLETEVEQADSDGRHEHAVKVLDELMSLNASGAGAYALRKFEILLVTGKDPSPAYQFARLAVDGPLKDDAEALNELAWAIMEDERPLRGIEAGRGKRDLELAFKAAARAVELTAGRDAAVLDTMARAYHERGDLEKAIEFQTKAVEAASEQGEKAEYGQRLEEYRDQRARRKDR